jgi:NADH-quinone oxidoreductase subunit G
MPGILINGHPVEAGEGQTVLQAALANGFFIPHFCWHPALSVAGSCRMCMVDVDGRGLDIACNIPARAGMRIVTDSEEVRANQKAMLEFILLNHPVDCGVCDKAGECTLQDYHYTYNGAPSVSVDPKLRSTKFYELSRRILLDNERCILCSRCVRFTREISKSHVLGIEQRGDGALVRPAEDRDAGRRSLLGQCGGSVPRGRLVVAGVSATRPGSGICSGPRPCVRAVSGAAR